MKITTLVQFTLASGHSIKLDEPNIPIYSLHQIMFSKDVEQLDPRDLSKKSYESPKTMYYGFRLNIVILWNNGRD